MTVTVPCNVEIDENTQCDEKLEVEVQFDRPYGSVGGWQVDYCHVECPRHALTDEQRAEIENRACEEATEWLRGDE